MIDPVCFRLVCSLPAIGLLGSFMVAAQHEAFADASQFTSYVDDAVEDSQPGASQADVPQLAMHVCQAPDNLEDRFSLPFAFNHMSDPGSAKELRLGPDPLMEPKPVLELLERLKNS